MKYVFLILGFLTLGLGAVGTVLPFLPTTPLLLVSAFCFAKSSERVNSWFKGTKLYQDNLESFVQGKGMTKAAKLRIMTTVSILMAIGFLMMKNVPVARMVLLGVWIAHVIFFVFGVKTMQEVSLDDEIDSTSQIQR